MKFILEKVKSLELGYNIEPGTFSESHDNKKVVILDLIMQNKKAHLFHLIPLLSEFITSKDNDIKQVIKEIFKILSSEMGIDMTM